MRRRKITAALLSAMMAISVWGSQMNIAFAAEQATKDETVYVSQDSDGNITEINVTDVLSNIGAGEVTDTSTLDNIENTKGSESYTKGTGDSLTWQAENEDITYQGTTDEKPPVGVFITYKLDGTTVTAAELAGKSGKVEITLRYENSSTYHDIIDTRDTLMTTPFFMLSAIVMDETVFSNVEVSQGKVVSEGDTQIAIAYGMPGFSKALKLSGDMKESIEEKLSDTVTITADAINFELDSIYTVATADLLSEMEFDKDTDDELDKLEDALDDMIEASDELISGSSGLTEGLNTLNTSFDAFSNGITGLKDGAKALADGTKQLSAGMKSYADGVKTLKTGTDQYVDGTASLADGVISYIAGEQQIAAGASALYAAVKDFPALYTTFSSSFITYLNGVHSLLGKENMDKLTAGTNALASGAATEEAMLNALDAGYNSAYNTLADLSAAIEASNLTDEQKAAYSQALASLNALTNDESDSQTPSLKKAAAAASGIKSGADTLDASASALSKNAETIRSGSDALKTANTTIAASISSTVTGVQSVNDGLTSLSAYNETLSTGAETLKKSGASLKRGVKELNKNAKLFKTSTSQLQKGANALLDGAKTLNSAAPEVKKGISALASGSSALTGGLKTFKSEGTEKMKETYEDNIKTVINRFRSMTGENARYESFTGISDDMEGSVKFIFQTEEIKADTE